MPGQPLETQLRPAIDFIEFFERIENLIRFQDKIEIAPSVDQIWQALVNELNTLIEVEECALFLVDEKSRAFDLKASFPEEMAEACQKEVDAQIDSGMFATILRRGLPALMPPLTVQNKTALMMPLTTMKRTVGMVLAMTGLKQSTVTQENIKLLTLLTRQCSLIIENSLLYGRLKKDKEELENAYREIQELSRTDPLTRVYNRGYLMERLPMEIKRSVRYERPLAVALCDIDHFKQVNDTHGHQAGDDVLKSFAAAISSHIRKDVDWVARYGGEEFLIVLPETSLEQAFFQAERLRKAVADTPVKTTAGIVRISSSFGVTALAKGMENTTSSDDMIAVADRCLYEAKTGGRNRTVQGEMPASPSG